MVSLMLPKRRTLVVICATLVCLLLIVDFFTLTFGSASPMMHVRTHFGSRPGAGFYSNNNAYNSDKETKDPKWAKDAFNQNRCNTYFDRLNETNPLWEIKISDNGMYDTNRRSTRKSVRDMREYINCFLRNHVPTHHNINDLERRLYPIFKHNFPNFTRFDGKTVSGRFINEQDFATSSGEDNVSNNNKKEESANYSFFNDLKHQSNSRGIVVSLGEGRGVHETVSLLHVLRLQSNNLPIELVHKGDLKEESMNQLIRAAREPFAVPKSEHLSKYMQKGVSGEINHDHFDRIVKNPQELWFVNTEPCIANDASFARFNNKWLAVLFNSFDEMLMMDTDSVPFVNLADLYEFEEYKRYQAYFFQDRAINYERVSDYESSYKEYLLPSHDEIQLYGMEDPGKVLNNPLFGGSNYKNYLESGLFIVSRKRHLSELLMAISLNYFKDAHLSFHGDKEFFWFGFAVAGSEQYVVNEIPAGSIGQKERGEGRRKDGTAFNYNVSFGTQPAHMSKNRTLLWINSGMQTCKVAERYLSDWHNYEEIQQKYGSEDSYKTYLESPLKADGVLLTSLLPRDVFDEADVNEIGFKQCRERGCDGYTWCAYDTPDYPAEWVQFDHRMKDMFDTVSRYWMANVAYFPAKAESAHAEEKPLSQ